MTKENFSLVKRRETILATPMKTPQDAAEVFAEYLRYWMKKRELDNQAVVDKMKRRYGTGSPAAMTNIMSAKPTDMMVRTVQALADAIGRPPEEVFMAKLGHARVPPRENDVPPSYFANLERRLADLPNGELKRSIMRFMRMIERELDEAPVSDRKL